MTKRPIEADYTSHVAYTRALEAYCDSLEQPAVEPNGWRPIDTAPKDGTAVLVMRDLWPGTSSGHAENCNGHNTYVAAWWDGENAWVCYMDAVYDPQCPVVPTHWMPLPHPPSAPQAQQPQESKCNTHPRAHHGFDRNASHSAHRYVCECESWEPYQAGYDEGFQAGMKSEQALCMLAENTQELEQPAVEPVAWMVRNGAVNYQLTTTKEQAQQLAAGMQKRHDLSGSLALFTIHPLYIAV